MNFPSNILNRSCYPQFPPILNVHVCWRDAPGRLGKRLADKRESNRYLSTRSSDPLIFNRIGDIVELQFWCSRSSLCGAQPARVAFHSSSRLKLNSRVYSNINLFLRDCLNLYCVFLWLRLFLHIKARGLHAWTIDTSCRWVVYSFARCFCYFWRQISNLFLLWWSQVQMRCTAFLGV